MTSKAFRLGALPGLQVVTSCQGNGINGFVRFKSCRRACQGRTKVVLNDPMSRRLGPTIDDMSSTNDNIVDCWTDLFNESTRMRSGFDSCGFVGTPFLTVLAESDQTADRLTEQVIAVR